MGCRLGLGLGGADHRGALEQALRSAQHLRLPRRGAYGAATEQPSLRAARRALGQPPHPLRGGAPRARRLATPPPRQLSRLLPPPAAPPPPLRPPRRGGLLVANTARGAKAVEQVPGKGGRGTWLGLERYLVRVRGRVRVRKGLGLVRLSGTSSLGGGLVRAPARRRPHALGQGQG